LNFLGDDGAIFRVGVFHDSLAFHCKTLNIP
jgi:hypothetical protein